MKMIKALLLAAVLLLPVAAFAMEGEQQVDYTEALRDGNVKKVKKYGELESCAKMFETHRINKTNIGLRSIRLKKNAFLYSSINTQNTHFAFS
jgi:hypothetical protein